MGKKVKVTLLFFAAARELSGYEERTAELDERITYGKLLETLNKEYNLTSLGNRFMIALNSEQLDCELDEQVYLVENCDIAVIPPIAGG